MSDTWTFRRMVFHRMQERNWHFSHSCTHLHHPARPKGRKLPLVGSCQDPCLCSTPRCLAGLQRIQNHEACQLGTEPALPGPPTPLLHGGPAGSGQVMSLPNPPASHRCRIQGAGSEQPNSIKLTCLWCDNLHGLNPSTTPLLVELQ